jgi:hypothetical protein
VDLWADVVDSVHHARDLFHGFIFGKIIPLNMKNPRTPYFYKNTLELFQNYILVPIILHFGPEFSFYNYD